MNHRKHNHSENVPTCRNLSYGSCEYGPGSCWFKHSDTVSENANANEIENDNITEKLLSMMETFAWRLTMIENTTKETA